MDDVKTAITVKPTDKPATGRWFCDTCGWYTKSEREKDAHARDAKHEMRREA